VCERCIGEIDSAELALVYRNWLAHTHDPMSSFWFPLSFPDTSVTGRYSACTDNTAEAIAVGWYFACALRKDGSIVCWGTNSNGQLGIGSTNDVGATGGDNLVMAPVNLGTGYW
jgi:hypothetical protein